MRQAGLRHVYGLYTIPAMRGIADVVAMPEAVQRRTVAEGVYRALKRDVITLRHRPGASLTEQELAAAYGSSRVPVVRRAGGFNRRGC